MQALEVFQIPVEERVLVVPLDLQRQRAGPARANVVDLVAGPVPERPAVHRGHDLEHVLAPAGARQHPAQPLGRGRLAAARGDQLRGRNRDFAQRGHQLRRLVREVVPEDRLRMVARRDVEPRRPQRRQQRAARSRHARQVEEVGQRVHPRQASPRRARTHMVCT